MLSWDAALPIEKSAAAYAIAPVPEPDGKGVAFGGECGSHM
jgi:hypothetical protein